MGIARGLGALAMGAGAAIVDEKSKSDRNARSDAWMEAITGKKPVKTEPQSMMDFIGKSKLGKALMGNSATEAPEEAPEQLGGTVGETTDSSTFTQADFDAAPKRTEWDEKEFSTGM